MRNYEPPIHGRNLYVLFNIGMQIVPFLLFPAILLVACWLIVVVSADAYCTAAGCTAVPRAGAVVLMLGIVYTYLQEFVIPTPDAMAKELRNDPLLISIHQTPGSERITSLLDTILMLAERFSRPYVRAVELVLLLGGTFISGFGDLFGLLIAR